MAGGPGSPELVAAVLESDAFAFLPSGYLSAAAFAENLEKVRQLTARPFGANLFVPGQPGPTPELESYRRLLEPRAAALGTQAGEPRWSDDEYAAKLELVIQARLPVVSFTFGCPSREDVQRLHEAGVQAVVTVTSLTLRVADTSEVRARC